MQFNLITAFPHFYNSFLETSLIKKAYENDILNFKIVDLKEFGIGKYKKIDDIPFGGGIGMVIRVDVIKRALESIEDTGYIIALSPSENLFTQEKASELSKKHSIITLLCGRYEGFDERVFNYVHETISIGQYITMGGETPSLVLIESISRLVPNVLGKKESTEEESYTGNIFKEYPKYTKPVEFEGETVPEVLRSGNHKAILKWKDQHTLKKAKR